MHRPLTCSGERVAAQETHGNGYALGYARTAQVCDHRLDGASTDIDRVLDCVRLERGALMDDRDAAIERQYPRVALDDTVQTEQTHVPLIYSLAGGRATLNPTLLVVLFAYAFISNIAMAIIPHEPVVIWYGAQAGIWTTAAVATLGTLAAAWVDHRLFVPLIARVAHKRFFAEGTVGWLRARFSRAPFAVLAMSGVAPLPAFPFKAMAFAEGYPIGRYLAAVAVGRFPRYALLAWLGLMITIPTWLLVTLFAVMMLPSLRLLWRRRKER